MGLGWDFITEVGLGGTWRLKWDLGGTWVGLGWDLGGPCNSHDTKNFEIKSNLPGINQLETLADQGEPIFRQGLNLHPQLNPLFSFSRRQQP